LKHIIKPEIKIIINYVTVEVEEDHWHNEARP
jgi:hypothetical protein